MAIAGITEAHTALVLVSNFLIPGLLRSGECTVTVKCCVSRTFR